MDLEKQRSNCALLKSSIFLLNLDNVSDWVK